MNEPQAQLSSRPAQEQSAQAQIRVRRVEFGTDSDTLETESASTWDATQARLDKKWAALTALVDKA